MLKRLMLIGLALLLCACSKLTMENYAKLKVGLAYEEVKGLLGEPAQCSEAIGIRACQWGDQGGPRSCRTARHAAAQAHLR